MARKKCAGCGKLFEAKTGRAKFCRRVECRRERNRKAKRAERRPVEQEVGGDQVRAAGGVFASTLSALTEAGRVNTPAGQNALALATRIDWGAMDTGSSIAALSKQHLAALGEALKDIEVAEDPVDELQARRSKRLASA